MKYEELQKRISESLKKMTSSEREHLATMVNSAVFETKKSTIPPEERSKRDKWQQFTDNEIEKVFLRHFKVMDNLRIPRQLMIVKLESLDA